MLSKAIAVFIVCVLAIGLVGNGYAHKAEVIGDYKVEVGWENEPPIVGQKNAIEIIVTVATEFEKESHESEKHEEHMEHEGEMEHDESIEHEGMTHEEHEEEMKMMEEEEHDEHNEEMEHGEELAPGSPVSGLSDKLEAVVTLNGKKTDLVLVESTKAGVYHSDYNPVDAGFPSVNLVGEIGHEEFEITFHPEKVEELNILAPLKQIQFNVMPSEVECKSEKVLIIKNSNGNPACVSPSSADKLVSLGWGIRA